MILIALALTAIALPLIEGRLSGWPAWSWVSLGASVVLLGFFARCEQKVSKRGGAPLVDMSLFRERAFSAGLGAQLIFWTGQASYFLVLALYLQFGRGLDPLGAGLIFMAIGAGYMATSTTARLVAAKIGRQVIALGGALRIVGLLLLILALAHIGDGGNIAWLVPALIIDGAGQGLAVAGHTTARRCCLRSTGHGNPDRERARRGRGGRHLLRRAQPRTPSRQLRARLCPQPHLRSLRRPAACLICAATAPDHGRLKVAAQLRLPGVQPTGTHKRRYRDINRVRQLGRVERNHVTTKPMAAPLPKKCQYPILGLPAPSGPGRPTILAHRGANAVHFLSAS
jgi:hypothetical protein